MLDRLGIAATSLCALHCILLPVLLPALPLLGISFFADHVWEHVFLIVTAVLGTFALLSGYKRYHRRLYPLYLLFIGVFVYWQKHDFAPETQPFIIVLGASLIVAAHIINIKLCNSCKQCTQDECKASS
jgi:hypothetical protein